jgi:hypothetical protein
MVVGHGSASGSAKKGEITKCVETDIEFEELTRERSQEALVGGEWEKDGCSASRSSEDVGVEVRVPEASHQMRWV